MLLGKRSFVFSNDYDDDDDDDVGVQKENNNHNSNITIGNTRRYLIYDE
jgi:hypothetical protein